MVNKKKSQQGKAGDIVENLLRQPAKDLSRHIQLLENEIKVRIEQSDESMTRLGTQRLMLEDKIKRLRYSTEWGDLFHRNLIFQCISVDKEVAFQAAQLTRELFELEEKLLRLRSELKLEKNKFKLIK